MRKQAEVTGRFTRNKWFISSTPQTSVVQYLADFSSLFAITTCDSYIKLVRWDLKIFSISSSSSRLYVKRGRVRCVTVAVGIRNMGCLPHMTRLALVSQGLQGRPSDLLSHMALNTQDLESD